MGKQYLTPKLGIELLEELDVLCGSVEVGFVGDDNLTSWEDGWSTNN